MRFGSILLVAVAMVSGLEGMTRMTSAQTSVGFTDPTDMEALLSYRLPDWGYRTISLQLGLLGTGEKVSPCSFCQEATRAEASEALWLSWYRESEDRVWSLSGGQSGSWNWNQTHQEPEDTIASALRGSIFVGAFNRNYLAGDLFTFESASANAAYQEARAHEGSDREVFVSRNFRGSLGLGLGLGRIRDVTPVVQAQRLSERLQALGHEPLPVEDVLRLANVFAQDFGYQRVFDRPSRQLWRDVLEPLLARGETLTPFEVFYLSDVFYEALGSRREGFLIDVGGQVQRDTRDNGSSSSATDWGPSVGLEWSHNLNLDHQLSASANGSYSWSDYDFDDGEAERQLGLVIVSFQHQWVVADRFLWSNRLRDAFRYTEQTLPFSGGERLIFRNQDAQLRSLFSFYVEDRVSMGPGVEVNWRHSESEGNWSENLSWTLQFNITYDLENALF